MRAILFLRAMFFVVLLPGTVAIYAPLRILQASGRLVVPALSFVSLVAGVLLLAGCAVLLMCVWEFFASGRGTLAPIDPPRFLVVSGLYRFTRNPMYNGVLGILLGEASLFRSLAVLEYAGGFFLAAHLFVVFYEERALTSRFGESFRAYCTAVPRWGVTFTRYARPPESLQRS
jgi:protein-S-isoprenylcysteine O-methyltransferase Ste14